MHGGGKVKCVGVGKLKQEHYYTLPSSSNKFREVGSCGQCLGLGAAVSMYR